MKFFILLLSLAVYTAYAVPVGSDNIPDDNSVQITDATENVGEQSDIVIGNGHYLIEYYLFTRSNPTSAHQLNVNDEESIKSSTFNPNNPVIVIAHGFLGSHNSDMNPTIRDAYLGIGDYNIIVLNWQRRGIVESDLTYRSTPTLGRFVGQFLRFLNQVTGAPYDSMHLIGFSLGAHLVANAGKELNGKVARITGLDPAGRLWAYHSDRMDATDAVYVEAIHTDPEFGINMRIADADFFVNGGQSQPGCLTSVCSHQRAWQVYAATVSYNHLLGRKCNNVNQMTFNLCIGDTLPMGNGDLNKRGSGLFRVNTRWRYPY